MSEVIKPFPLEEEYKKKTFISPADILKLRQWVDTQPHLPAEYITELDLILAYHCSDRSSEVAKQLIDLHYTLKTLFTNLFQDRVINDKILRSLSVYLFEPLKIRAYDDSAIIYSRLVNYDPKKFVFTEAIKCVLMMVDLWQYAEGTWPGLTILIDLDQLTITHVTKIAQELQTVQQFLHFLQEAMLLKIKGIHFLNAPSFMDKLMMIIKPFLKKKLLQILRIHQIGSTTIDQFLPIDALPNADSLEQLRDAMVEKVRLNASFFENEMKKRVTESRRPGKPKTISDFFGGIEGSFKKLDID